MVSTTPSPDTQTAPPTIADIVGGVPVSVSLEDLSIHASTKKSLLDVGWTIQKIYKVVELHGWQGIKDIMEYRDDSKIEKISAALVEAGLPALPDDKERRAVREVKEKRRALCMTCQRREKMKGKQKCRWCWLLAQPIEEQIRHADLRLEMAPEPHRPRVPEKEWPAGERWCAGCQSFVPTTYATGSRCKACASKAAHATRLKAVYGITREEYEELLEYQDSRCWICQRQVHSKRLAVDHDHKTGEVRGLLCSDNERGCNRAVLGNIRGIEMARRIVDYLEEPPARRLFGKEVGRIEPSTSYTGVDIYDPFA